MERALRLRRSADFARVRHEGKLNRHPILMLAVCANCMSCNRYGFVVSNALGSAVLRNRIRRRLRVLMRSFHDRMHQGYDIVVIARTKLAEQPFSRLQRIVSGLLTKAQLMKVH